MKKFTDLENINENNTIKIGIDLNSRIQQLIDENLNIEIEGEEKPWEKSFKITADSKFYEGIEKLINNLYHKEKLEILDKARKSHFTNDFRWMDVEVEKIRESLKKQ